MKNTLLYIGVVAAASIVTLAIGKKIESVREKNISYSEGDENHEN